MEFRIKDIQEITNRITAAVEANKDLLGELDGKSGDGDLGISMQLAFQALNTASKEYKDSDIGKMLFQMAKACNKAAPSTMGTLLSSGIMGLAKSFKGKISLTPDDVISIPRIFANAITERGKAKVGDKTILDALVPFCESLESAYNGRSDLQESFQQSAVVAEQAAKATSGMRAKIGRAKWLGERAAEYPDAGAVLWSIIAKSLVHVD